MAGDTSILDSLVAVPHPAVATGAEQSPTATLDSLAPVPHPAAPQSQSNPYPVRPDQMTGWSPVLGAGVKRGVIDAVSMLADPPLNAIIGPRETPVLDEQGNYSHMKAEQPDLVRRMLEWLGGSPSQVVPSSRAQEIGGEMAGGAAGMVAGGPLFGGLRSGATTAMNALTGAAGGAAGEIAARNVPEPFQDAARLGANVAGSLGAGVAAEGARAGFNGVTSAGGRMGIGPKTEVAPGVRATESQVVAAGRKAQDILGPEGQQQLSQFGMIERQARDLEAKIGSADTPPAERMLAQKQLQALQSQREQLVPGAQPTTAQLIPNEKTVAYERDMRTLNNPQFATRDAANTQAMQSAMQGAAPGAAGPEAVANLVRRHLDAIDQAGQRTVGAARQNIEGATERLGGEGTPAQYGEGIRGALGERDAAAGGRESALWQAIDPEGKLTLPMGSVQDTARRLLEEMNPNLGDAAAAQEMQILNGASGLPSVVPFRDAQRLRSNIGAAERGLRATPGNNQSLRRLGILKSSLDDAIGQAADGAAATDPDVVQRISNLAQREGYGSQPGGQNGPGNAGGSGGAAPGVSGAGGPGGPAAERPGNAAGDSGVAVAAPDARTTAGLEPNFDPEAAARYAAARQSTLERKQTYGQGVIGRTLQPGQRGAEFRLEAGSVPHEFLTGKATEPARVQQYIAAVGGEPQAVANMRDALVNDLRQKGVVQPDGTIKGSAFDRWMQQRGQTIDLFPGLREQLGSARQAQQLLDDAAANHVAAVKEFQTGAARDFLKVSPEVASDRIFTSGNSRQTARELYGLVKDNPDALAGLRRGVIDNLDRKFNLDPTASDPIKSKAFRDYIDQHRDAMKIIFSGQGAQNIDMVEAMLNRIARAKQAEATLGSNTAQKVLGSISHGGGKLAEGGRMALFAILGEHLMSNAASMLGHEGLVGIGASAAGLAGGAYLSMLRRAGISTMNDLGREMMLNPELTWSLMQKVPADAALAPTVQRRIAAALQSAIVDNAAQGKKQ